VDTNLKYFLVWTGLKALGAVRKRRPQSGGSLSSVTFCGQGEEGFFRCGSPHFLVQKKRRIF